MSPALIIQASLQTDQNSTGFAEAFPNLIFVVVLLMDLCTGQSTDDTLEKSVISSCLSADATADSRSTRL